MNGRVYDPDLGRFLSPDPFVQNGANPQNLNRYTYVDNNPLSYTDPSGFFFKKLFKSIGKLFVRGLKRLFKQFVRGLKQTFSVKNLITVGAYLACGPTAGPACAAAASGGYTAANGGSIIEVIHSAVATYNAFNGASTGQVSAAAENAETIARFAEAIEDDLNKRDANVETQQQIRKATLGGAIDQYGGDKFANGAATVAFNITNGFSEIDDTGVEDTLEDIDRIEKISDALTVGGILIDILTGPSGEGVAIGVAIGSIRNKAIREAFERQLKQHGLKSLKRSRKKIQRRLDEHKKKLDELQKQGGHTSSVEREIRTFQRQLESLDDLLGK